MRVLLQRKMRFDYNTTLAAFLSLIHRGNVALSNEIHQSKLLKSYSLSPLLVSGENAFWNLNVFDERIMNALAKTLREWNLNDPLQMGNYKLDIRKVEFSTEFLSAFAPFHTHVLFEFVSPTTFRRTVNGRRFNYPLPEPDVVFSSLAKRAAEIHMGEFDHSLKLPITISKMENIKTSVAFYKGIPLKGFTGKVEYFCMGSEEEIRTFSFLSNLAKYTGVGYKTTAGLGYVRIQLIK